MVKPSAEMNIWLAFKIPGLKDHIYKVGTIGIEKLILHLRYEAGPIGNHAVPKLGASIALAWR